MRQAFCRMAGGNRLFRSRAEAHIAEQSDIQNFARQPRGRRQNYGYPPAIMRNFV